MLTDVRGRGDVSQLQGFPVEALGALLSEVLRLGTGIYDLVVRASEPVVVEIAADQPLSADFLCHRLVEQ
jgi:hypothetical protein